MKVRGIVWIGVQTERFEDRLRFERVADAEHQLPLDQPDTVLPLMREFVLADA